jgi:hypothetical protein
MQWYHANSMRKKKFKAAPLAGRIMTIFWDSKGLLLVIIRKEGSTINFKAHANMLKSFCSEYGRRIYKLESLDQ